MTQIQLPGEGKQLSIPSVKQPCGCYVTFPNTNCVPGYGVAGRIMFIGEAPGADEDAGVIVNGVRVYQPFVGGAGRILTRLCYEAGFSRYDHVYITNIVRHRPPNNNMELSKGYEQEFPRLREEIRTVNPRVIVPLGNYALALFNKWGIQTYRGAPFWYEGIPVIPTIHPAALMRGNQELWPVVIHDLERVWRIASSVNISWLQPERNYIPHPSVHEAHAIVDRITERTRWVLDVETTMEHDQLNFVGVTDRKHHGVCIPVNEDFIGPLMKLSRKSGDCSMQNGLFDMNQMEGTFGATPICRFDTMLAHHLVCSSLPHDQGFLNSCYADLPYYKKEMREDTEVYNCKDLDSQFQCTEGLEDDVKRYGMWSLFQSIMAAQPIVHKMARRGICYDLRACEEESIRLDNRCAELLALMCKEAGDPFFNPNSPKQVMEILFNKLGVPKLYHKKTGRPTTEDDQLEKHKKIPFVRWLLEYRHWSKMRSTYIPGEDELELIDENYGLTHSSPKMHGTETGRFSWGIHTYPPEMRRIVVARPGYRLGYFDLSQVEFRVCIYASGDKLGRELLEAGGDIHRRCASLWLKKPESEVTKTERFLCKFVVHGSNYGRSPQSVAEQFGISVAEAESIQDDILGQFIELNEWREAQVEHAYKNGFSINYFKRRRYYFNTPKNEVRRQALNFYPQSTSHDMLLLMYPSIAAIENFHPILDHHDAIMGEFPIEAEDVVMPQLKEIANKEWLPGLRVPADVKSGTSWKDFDDRQPIVKWKED